MKTKYLLLWTPVAAMAFSACSSEEEGFTPSVTNEIRVVTEVNSYSRAGYTTENLEAFGLIIGSDSESFSYHKQMVKNGAAWSTADGQSMYWEDRGKAVDVIAYAPYRTDEINAKSKIEVDVQPDQSTEDGVKASDFGGHEKRPVRAEQWPERRWKSCCCNGSYDGQGICKYPVSRSL